MTENYLQLLWKQQRFPPDSITLFDSSAIDIIHPGTHNTNESGPDFLNGKVRIGELDWCGNIEVHVKSSDWFKHGHEMDPAYDNVILHVVFENDVDLVINGVQIPTIELKDLVDWEHYSWFKNFYQKTNEIMCIGLIDSVDSIYFSTMKDRALINRLERKSTELNVHWKNATPEDILYFLLARTFGSKVNRLPFEEMVMQLPIKKLKELDKLEQIAAIQIKSGILSPDYNKLNGHTLIMHLKEKNFINASIRSTWKRKGVRHHSFPQRRIEQFALLISELDFKFTFIDFKAKEILKYVNEIYKNANELLPPEIRLSRSFCDLITINTIVPFIWWYATQNNHDELKEKAIDLLLMIPAESNGIVNSWKKCNVHSKNAFDSQALIEIYNEFCKNKKCLSCEVGIKLLLK